MTKAKKTSNDELLEMEDRWKRVQAEFLNFKKRVEEERVQSLKFEGENILTDILPVVDNLERALDHIPEELVDNEWVKGVLNINVLSKSILNQLKVEKVESIGKEADFNLHDVINQMPGDKDIIIHEVEPGYTYNGKLIRASKVIVGNGEKI